MQYVYSMPILPVFNEWDNNVFCSNKQVFWYQQTRLEIN